MTMTGFSDILVRRGAGKGDIDPINNLMSAYKAAAGIQSLLKITAKIFGIAFNSDNTEQQIGIRDTQTFLQHTVSNLKIYNPTAPEAVYRHWPIFLLISMTVRMIP